jgi:hypothetical protein
MGSSSRPDNPDEQNEPVISPCSGAGSGLHAITWPGACIGDSLKQSTRKAAIGRPLLGNRLSEVDWNHRPNVRWLVSIGALTVESLIQ